MLHAGVVPTRGMPTTHQLQVVVPSMAELGSYVAALQRGWSPDSMRSWVAREQLQRIDRGPAAFLAGLVDVKAEGAPIVLPDGSKAPRLPGCRRWLWDGEFCGHIGMRWQVGIAELPSYCLGHIGFSVVPWKQRRGCATRAHALLLPEARALCHRPP